METLSDVQKIKNLPEERKNQLIEDAVEYTKEINGSIMGGNHTLITEWFQEYFVSEQFQGLSIVQKRESFEHYNRLFIFLENINDFMCQNKLGCYNFN